MVPNFASENCTSCAVVRIEERKTRLKCTPNVYCSKSGFHMARHMFDLLHFVEIMIIEKALFTQQI